MMFFLGILLAVSFATNMVVLIVLRSVFNELRTGGAKVLLESFARGVGHYIRGHVVRIDDQGAVEVSCLHHDKCRED